MNSKYLRFPSIRSRKARLLCQGLPERYHPRSRAAASFRSRSSICSSVKPFIYRSLCLYKTFGLQRIRICEPAYGHLLCFLDPPAFLLFTLLFHDDLNSSRFLIFLLTLVKVRRQLTLRSALSILQIARCPIMYETSVDPWWKYYRGIGYNLYTRLRESMLFYSDQVRSAILKQSSAI